MLLRRKDRIMFTATLLHAVVTHERSVDKQNLPNKHSTNIFP